MLYEIVTVAVGLVAIVVFYFKRKYVYWNKLGVEQLSPKIFVGDFYDVFAQKVSIGDQFFNIYKAFKSKKLNYGGVYMLNSPVFVPLNADLVKNILLKDSNHFIDRGIYHNEELDPLSAHLFTIEGERWKYLRTKLSPTFTSGKMKAMFHIVSEHGDKLTDTVNRICKTPIDIKEILACFSTDVIASCAFGIECDSLNNPHEEFRKYGRLAFTMTTWAVVKGIISLMAPELMKKLNVILVNKKVSNYFLGITKNNLEYREINQIHRPDFFNLLIQLKNKGEVSDDDEKSEKTNKSETRLTFNELAAQAFVFFLGGFETSSTVMTFVLYELSRNTKMQEKVRSEINTVLDKYDGKVTYEALTEMQYLEGVINETMRIYPPVPILNRICTQEYKVPNSDITIKKGIPVLLPVKGYHMDPDYFPNPTLFNPERFSKDSTPPFTYLPFGDGPRICIGMRFGVMQTKIGLIALIRNFEITFNPKTKPIVIDPTSFVSSPKDKVYLDFKRISLL